MRQLRRYYPATGGVPHLHRVVIAASREASTVFAEGDSQDRTGVIERRSHLLARLDIPDARGQVGATGRQSLAVRVEFDGIDRSLVGRDPQRLAGRRLPQ